MYLRIVFKSELIFNLFALQIINDHMIQLPYPLISVLRANIA